MGVAVGHVSRPTGRVAKRGLLGVTVYSRSPKVGNPIASILKSNV